VLMIFDFYYYWDCTIRQRLTSSCGAFRTCTLSTLFQKTFGIPMVPIVLLFFIRMMPTYLHMLSTYIGLQLIHNTHRYSPVWFIPQPIYIYIYILIVRVD
jgi:hypothetical protein